MSSLDYLIHQIGWKAFQDLCIAIVEERLDRPVQTFLPSNDAGRDGAFRGCWDDLSSGESTIQCKYTEIPSSNLTLSALKDELPKAERLAKLNLADDYIILTNHVITGKSELAIKKAFQDVGVGRCRVFHRDWILQQVQESSKLRMMVPRLYGLLDLSTIFDNRAYKQAQLILSEMGDNLKKLVLTDAYKRSVKAISEHKLVLLLGSPAAGKSTIGASLALGANDMWQCMTIKSTSPQHLESHIDPDGGQFFWIDDAWGSTQYQADRTEAWNQVFPLMQGAMRNGTRFLITSRDYIWHSARRELKLQALPVLSKSQVVINVQELTTEEKARILFNHVKLGDQSSAFRKAIKSYFPSIAKRSDFLPESARRLGNQFFTEKLSLTERGLTHFFAFPKRFLEETIENLSPANKAAIALVFLNGGAARSPVPTEHLEKPANAFGVTVAAVREDLEALNGSVLHLIEDEDGPYWTYRHPTVSDAFASYLAKSPELVELYLRGAKPETILGEVVCAGINIAGASVVVPKSLNALLVDRISHLPNHSLGVFIANRANQNLAKLLMEARPDIWNRLHSFYAPLRDDLDVPLFFTLFKFGLISEEQRQVFVKAVRNSLHVADSSLWDDKEFQNVLNEAELDEMLCVTEKFFTQELNDYIVNLRKQWSSDYSPDSHFDDFLSAISVFSKVLPGRVKPVAILESAQTSVHDAILEMEEQYSPQDETETEIPEQKSSVDTASLEELFRDVDN